MYFVKTFLTEQVRETTSYADRLPMTLSRDDSWRSSIADCELSLAVDPISLHKTYAGGA